MTLGDFVRETHVVAKHSDELAFPAGFKGREENLPKNQVIFVRSTIGSDVNTPRCGS
jgi:hypothetical protein